MARQLAKSVVTLRDQVNRKHPHRKKTADGTWPSAAHRKASPNSDHNTGHAIDFTHSPESGFNAHKFADHLVATRDPRLKYVISNRRIASAKTGWKWVKYNGASPHSGHVHISVNRHGDSSTPWKMPAPVGVAMGFASSVVGPTVTGEPDDLAMPDELLPPQEGDDGIDEIEEAEGHDEVPDEEEPA